MTATPLPAEARAAAPDRVVRLTRVASLASLLGLIVLILAWELWLAPTGNRSLALLALPLALPVAGLLRNRMYTHRWVSLLVWPYFALGVVRATTESMPGAALAWLEVLLCLVLFGASALHVRWRLKVAAAAAPAASPERESGTA